MDVLARASDAGVDPYTVLVGQAIAQPFRMGPQGRTNVQNAIAELTSFGSVGDALWFSIDVESFMRKLAKTTKA